VTRPRRLHWHAWYTEGREFDSHETDWLTLPPSGVLAVTAYYFVGDQIYRENKNGGDWYWYKNGDVFYVSSGPEVNGTWKEQPKIGCRSCVKQGVMVSDEEWARVLGQVRVFRGYHVPAD